MEKKEQLEFVYDKAENVFAEIIEVAVRNDIAYLGVATKNKTQEMANVSHKVYMTVGQFINFAKVCTQISEQIQQQIKESIPKVTNE